MSEVCLLFVPLCDFLMRFFAFCFFIFVLDFLAWFCVCKLGGSWAGEANVSFVVVDGASASALGYRRVCVEVV